MKRSTLLLFVGVLGATVAASAPSDAAPRPLQSLMKSIDLATRMGDFRQVAAVLNYVEIMAPKQFPEWAPITQKARAAAGKGDMDGLKKQCADFCRANWSSAKLCRFADVLLNNIISNSIPRLINCSLPIAGPARR